MTDTSKEAEIEADKFDPAYGEYFVTYTRFTALAEERDALAARVGELEAAQGRTDPDLVEVLRKEVAMTARGEALREAADAVAYAEVQDAYDQGHRIHFDDLQEFFADAILAKLEDQQ